jgi:phage/plasmid-associated DNA primase
MIVWGSKACNGKSTLWSDILSKILGPFFDNVDSETFGKKKSGNNDGLVNLQGKRAGHIDEPEQDSDNGNGLKMSLFKNFTSGKGEIKASAKFITQEGFKAKTKLIFSCNTIPDFNFKDLGVDRRINILEQNTEFVYMEQYEKMTEEQKKNVQLRNDKFVEKLLNNSEGLLKWALLGSNKYIDDPKLPPPASMIKTKETVKEESDELGNWILRNLVSDETCDVALSSLKSFWKMNELDFGQRKKGFNKSFLLECEKHGFRTNPGREQKAEEKILGCRRVLTQKEIEMSEMSKKINI